MNDSPFEWSLFRERRVEMERISVAGEVGKPFDKILRDFDLRLGMIADDKLLDLALMQGWTPGID